MKKVLLISGPNLGDLLVRIPLIEKLKKEGFKVFILNEALTDRGIVVLKSFNVIQNEEIISLSSRKMKNVSKFILKNAFKFDYVFCTAPATKKVKLLAYFLFPKKVFSSDIDFTTKDTNIIEEDRLNLSRLLKKEINYRLEDFSYVFEESRFKIKEDLKKEIEELKNYCVVFVGYEHRSLSRDTWIKLIEFLKRKYEKIILIGESDTLWFNIDHSDKISDLRKKLTLLESLYILKKSSLNVVTNSGMMWFSIMNNKKTIAFQGPSTFIWQYDSLNTLNIRIWNYDNCIGYPCEWNCIFKDFRCIKSIKFQDIKAKIEEFI